MAHEVSGSNADEKNARRQSQKSQGKKNAFSLCTFYATVHFSGISADYLPAAGVLSHVKCQEMGTHDVGRHQTGMWRSWLLTCARKTSCWTKQGRSSAIHAASVD